MLAKAASAYSARQYDQGFQCREMVRTRIRGMSSPAPPPLFRPGELLAMAEGCELSEVDVRRLAAAALVTDGAP
jgi:hypothetical protein